MEFPLICAAATPQGFGGIAIIRLSGVGSWQLVNKIFVPKHPFEAEDVKGYSLHYGHICTGDKTLDEVLVAYMKESRSYTGEEMAEIHCHGGYVSAQRIMELCFSHGAQLAQAGEFTKRAFLSGRIDLSQAEAVIETINAMDEKDLDYSVTRLKGESGRSFLAIRDNILSLVAEAEAVIDFPEDGLEDTICLTIDQRVEKLLKDVQHEIDKTETGKLFHKGIATAICGRTNVGKSSLLNALLKSERAIVTDIPGTTRDVIEETLLLEGIPLVLTDTAGIRETEDPVEKIGVDRSLKAINDAELVLLVTDHAEPDEEEEAILKAAEGREVIIVHNKADVVDYPQGLPGVTVSAVTGANLESIGARVKDLFLKGRVIPEDKEWTGNLRHKEIFLRVKSHLEDAQRASSDGMPLDFRIIDLRLALEALGEISGETVSEEILDRIFSDFCIGK